MKYPCCGHCEKPCPKDGHSKPCKPCAELKDALTGHTDIPRTAPTVTRPFDIVKMTGLAGG